MRKPAFFFALLLVMWTCTLPAFARQESDGQVRLSLEEAIQMALSNNNDIELARQNVRTAGWDLKGTAAEYAARSTFSSFYQRTKAPVASFLSGGVNGSVVQSGISAGYRLNGFAGKGGGTYEIDLSSGRQSTNNVFAALNPQYPSDLMLRYTQPLVRGRKFPARLKDTEIARKNLNLTQTELKQSVAETIVAVQKAYWDLVFARQSLTVQNETLRDIRQRLESDRRRAGNGSIAAIEVVNTEGRSARYEEDVYGALEQVTRAENAFKILVAENHAARLWNLSIMPTDSFNSTVSDITLSQALAAAMENRLELKETDIVAEINAIEQRYYSDQSRPQIDLVASYGIMGLGGSFVDNAAIERLVGPNAALPVFLDGGYGRSLTNLARNRFTDVRVGIEISLPFHNDAAEAKLGRALVERDRVATQQEKLKQLVTMDVRNAVQSVRTAESKRRTAVRTD
jgi:outer membrane protein TolC